jgi:hypothetical protein
MKHLEDEDIGRMIEGTISKRERENFLKHLSECSTCFDVYADTLKFMEKERKHSNGLKLPIIEKIKVTTQGLWQSMRDWLADRKPVLVPTFAVLVIILLIGPFVLRESHDRKIEKAQIQQIVMDIENMGNQAFSPSKDEIYAAVRAGIFVEDLTLVVNAGGHEELKTKISKMLSNELKAVCKNESNSLFQNLGNIEKKSLETVVPNIRGLIEKQSLSEPFWFGRFVENSTLSFFENKTPKQEDIEKYQRIIQKYKDKLPLGIFKKLKKLKTTSGVEESKKIFIDIKEIILSLE